MPKQRSADTNSVAVAYLLFGITCGLSLDITAKWLLADYSLSQFIFLRSAFALAAFLMIAGPLVGFSQLATKRWRWHVLRTLLACAVMFGFFNGLSHIPLVETLTLGFTAPLMVTALSAWLLRESVGMRRWFAVMVGFVGVLIVLRPGAGVLHPAALGVIAAAFFYACLAITARKLADTETSFALTVYVIIGPLLISAVGMPQQWRAPPLSDWGLFAVAGLCSAGAWVGIVGGYRRASPALLAPLEYLALLGGAVAGYLIWSEVPDRWVVLGSAVIIGSGLFVVYRDLKATISGRLARSSAVSETVPLTQRCESD